MTVLEAGINKLDREARAKMAKLSLDGARFALCLSENEVRNRQRFQMTYHGYVWTDSSLDWLVHMGWAERTKKGLWRS